MTMQTKVITTSVSMFGICPAMAPQSTSANAFPLKAGGQRRPSATPENNSPAAAASSPEIPSNSSARWHNAATPKKLTGSRRKLLDRLVAQNNPTP